MRVSVLLLLTIFSLNLKSQFSWKNKKPFADYWQQDVQYSIKAKVDERQLLVGGDIELLYTINSPDDLSEV